MRSLVTAAFALLIQLVPAWGFGSEANETNLKEAVLDAYGRVLNI